MTHPEVLQAYKEKYAALPDLVERIVSQFDYRKWMLFNYGKEISIYHLAFGRNTKEGYCFWGKIELLDTERKLFRETIDASYKEFGIEPLTPKIDMNAFVENGYYWPLFSYLSEVHGLTLIDTEMDDIINIVKDMLKASPDQIGLSTALQLTDLRPLLLRHPDKEMVTQSCLHFLGDAAQQWWNEREENKTE